MIEALTYDDVLLVPRYSDIKSRKEVDIGNKLHDGIHLSLPIISAPMDTVTGVDMATKMHEAGAMGIIHRYNSIEEQVNLVHKTRISGVNNIGAAIGTTGDFEERACALYDAGANIICVDVAHGHHILVKKTLEKLRSVFGDKIHIMAGNIATVDGFVDLSDWGADSIRCNIGGGSICSTRTQTGHGIPGLHTIFECSRTDRPAKVIADGGIRTSGDIVKALAAGADFVMLGSLLAGTDETPGQKITTATGIKKSYRGMASKEAQIDWHGKFSSNEGVATMIDYRGPVVNILNDLKNGITSGLSYSGVRSIAEFQAKAKFIKQTTAGLIESSAHILRK